MHAQATDITSWFKQQCAGLAPGQMVKEDRAELLQIMNALQMGDPQMDSGIRWKEQDRYNPDQELSPSDLCWIMDEMATLEYRFWSGANLCQSVFTSMHFHNVERLISNPSVLCSIVLKAYTLAYAKCVDLAYSEFARGNVRDGEDSWLDHYGVSVHLGDPTEDILPLFYTAKMVVEDEVDGPFQEALLERLEMRKELLVYLQYRQQPPRFRKLALVDNPSKDAAASFIDVSKYLRQSMPLPPKRIVTQEEAMKGIEVIYNDLALVKYLCGEVDWMLVLRGQAYRQEMNPLERSLFKSFISPPRGTPGPDTSSFLTCWISRHTGLPLDTLTTLSNSIPDVDRRQFAIWRDLFHGYLVTSLTVPLLNRPRQGRTFLSLSYAWYERAILADKLTPHHPAFAKIAQSLYAARLDALLEAALASIELDLISPNEEKMIWWWISLVAGEREKLDVVESWESVWARAWSDIALGMLSVLAPPSREIPKEQFELRFKWPRKVPKLDGVPYQTSIYPSYTAWTQFLNEKPGAAEPVEPSKRFANAINTLDLLADNLQGPCGHDYSVVVKELQDDLENVKAGGHRRRWIPTA